MVWLLLLISLLLSVKGQVEDQQLIKAEFQVGNDVVDKSCLIKDAMNDDTSVLSVNKKLDCTSRKIAYLDFDKFLPKRPESFRKKHNKDENFASGLMVLDFTFNKIFAIEEDLGITGKHYSIISKIQKISFSFNE